MMHLYTIQRSSWGLSPRVGFGFAAAALVFAAHFIPSVAEAKDAPLPAAAAPVSSQDIFDRGPSEAPAVGERFAPGDTVSFGYVDANGFAVEGEVWTFDHGHADPFEGWYATDFSENAAAYFRHMTAADWGADPFNTVPAPVLSGAGSAWCGVTGSEARDLCWEAGLGYGNGFCQRLVSPTFVHDGVNSVDLSWLHFNDTEPSFDYTNVHLKTLPSGEEMPITQYDGQIGLAPDHPVSPPTGVVANETLDPGDFGGEVTYQVIFEMTSDAGWSDSDGLFATEYGPCGFDDVSIDGSVFAFESDLDGWTAEVCGGFGTLFGVNDISNYVIEDACDCNLAGNVLEFHDEDLEHPYGQRVLAQSPPVDLANATPPSGDGALSILARWTQYSVLPQANGVFYRPGWSYFPYECPVSGEDIWKIEMQTTFFFFSEDPICAELLYSATEANNAIPRDSEQVRFAYEVFASCDAFSIPEDVCTGETNATPLIDNVVVETTRILDAPAISFDNGTRFQDGFAQSAVNNPSQPGNADVTRNVNFGAAEPVILGDSLYVSGPLAGSNPWEAKLWFQIEKVGPSFDSRYTVWRDQVADGKDIENGEWTFAFMDSFQIGTNVANNRFVSYFREDDDDFDGGSPELTDAQEIIPDGVLFPGTQVNYFVSSNYVGNSQNFLLPDTSGGFSLEFEILPNWQDDGGTLKHPCLLYVDAANDGAQYYIGNALTSLGLEADRYDYLDATSNWKAPLARGAGSGSNNGCTLAQLLGYRGIVVNSGTSNASTLMWPTDYLLFHDWLDADYTSCQVDGLILNGHGIATSLTAQAPVVAAALGVSVVSGSYTDFSGDTNDCVVLEAPSTGSPKYGTVNSGGDYSYEAFGNGCPTQYGFDVLGTVGSGVGNRVFVDSGDPESEVEFAQVVSENLSPTSSGVYRTVVDGTSYHTLTDPSLSPGCAVGSASIVTAAANELAAALEWIFDGSVPTLCEEFPPCAGDAPDGSVLGGATTKLHQSLPNPYNQRTKLRFSLAHSGRAKVTIYDAAGRQVRTVVDGELDAGLHEINWDGTDENGRSLPAGVYWVRLHDGVQESSAKIVSIE